MTGLVRGKVCTSSHASQGALHPSQDGVYDITDFIGQHPGGAKRIMLAAGGSVDSFWAMYAQHQKKEVADLLEGYRIGSLVRATHARTACTVPPC